MNKLNKIIKQKTNMLKYFYSNIPIFIFTSLFILLFAQPQRVFAYTSSAAVSYAETWCSSFNPAYANYSPDDCANFVSQCLKAGGMNISNGPGLDAYGCIISCDNLNTNFTSYQGCSTSSSTYSGHMTSGYPAWFTLGDVALFGNENNWDGDYWEHATLDVVSGTPVMDAHTNPHCSSDNKNISYFYPSSGTGFQTGDFYHFPAGGSCSLTGVTPTLVSPGTTSSPGSTIATTTPTLTWNAVPGATNYGVYVKDVNSGVLVVDVNCATSGTSYTVSGLSNGGQYKWNIEATVGCGGTCVSNYSSVLYFNTSDKNYKKLSG